MTPRHGNDSILARIGTIAVALMACHLLYGDPEKTAPANDMAFDRSDFANSRYGVWSHLTPFELDAIESFHAAQSGDANALLKLFLLASGDVRDRETFTRDQHRVDDWVKRVAGTVKHVDDQRRLGEELLRAMHVEFFPPSGERGNADLLPGYDLDQSQLSRIFVKRQFNCISSAMLYIIAARKFGLNAKAVVLPSHAFVQLDLNDGDTIEVETTSIDGYDVDHDETFFQKQAQRWSRDRSLTPLTYVEYLHRNIVEPYELGIYDMWSQHASAGRMAYRDRMRLSEIRSVLAPSDADAQKARLSFYTHEFSYLNDHHDYATLTRLYDAIDPYLNSLALREFHDAEFQRAYQWVRMEKAITWSLVNRQDRALQLARQLLGEFARNADIEKKMPDHTELERDAWLVVARYMEAAAGKGAFTRVRAAVDGMEGPCLRDPGCAATLAALYAKRGESFWRRREWRKAMDVYREYLRIDTDSDNANLFWRNLESAAVNLARDYVSDEDRHSAKKVLENCLSELGRSTANGEVDHGVGNCRRALSALEQSGRF